MYFVPALVFVLLSSAFETSIEQAFTATKNKDWPAAASALDQAVGQDAGAFDANNFHYLRGRVAEMQMDWARARQEFLKIGSGNPLHALATWHSLQDSLRQHDDASAEEFLNSREAPGTSCLIADVQMPGMTGLELHYHLLASGKTVPTILITAYPDDNVRERALSDGVVCYLSKPFDEDDLLACIRSSLSSEGP